MVVELFLIRGGFMILSLWVPEHNPFDYWVLDRLHKMDFVTQIPELCESYFFFPAKPVAETVDTPGFGREHHIKV